MQLPNLSQLNLRSGDEAGPWGARTRTFAPLCNQSKPLLFVAPLGHLAAMTGSGRGPPRGKRTAEDAAKSAAAKSARAAESAAARAANEESERTVADVEEELKRVNDRLISLMDARTGASYIGMEEEYNELEKQSKALEAELERKQKERAEALKHKVVFTKRDVDDALRPLFEELKSADRLGPTEAKLEAVRKEYEARIIELMKVKEQRRLTKLQQEAREKLLEARERPNENQQRVLQLLIEDEDDGTITDANAKQLARYRAGIWLTPEQEERLQELNDGDGLTKREQEELERLRENSARIVPATKLARKDLKERTDKANTKRRRQAALDDPKDPESHLNKEDKTWWDKDGRRQWRKLQRRAKLEQARADANLPADDDRPFVEEEPIDPSSLAGSSNAEWEEQMNAQMEAAGLSAIEALRREKEAEAQALRGVGYVDDEDDDDGVDGD